MMTAMNTAETASLDPFDRITAELDAIPSETWTDDEAWMVLLTLEAIRRGRQPAVVQLDSCK